MPEDKKGRRYVQAYFEHAPEDVSNPCQESAEGLVCEFTHAIEKYEDGEFNYDAVPATLKIDYTQYDPSIHRDQFEVNNEIEMADHT